MQRARDIVGGLALLEALIEETPAIVYVAAPMAARPLKRMSRALAQTLGYASPQDAPSIELWRKHIHPDDYNRVFGTCARALAGEASFIAEYRVLDCAGNTLWFHDEVTLLCGPDGHPQLLYGFIVNITEPKDIEARLRSYAHDLGERVKELDCLYTISYLSREGTIEEILDRVVRILPAAWQYPERACASIEFEGKAYTTDNYAYTLCRQSADIRVNGRHAGCVTVSYLDTDEPPETIFLQEERSLIEAIAGRIADVVERRTLEKEVLEISAREQRRVGQDLHDSLGQLLTGISCLASGLAKRLEEQARPEAAEAAEITELVRHANTETRFLAKGLVPVELDERGLLSALEELAYDTENFSNVACIFHYEDPILIEDTATALNLYRITQEATSNAIKHGKATTIVVRLLAENGKAALVIADDGTGFDVHAPEPSGMGLRIMKYRAQMIGGSLEIRPNSPKGTIVTCRFPYSDTLHEDKKV